MNYIKQINAAWSKMEEEQLLKSTAKIVYFALLQLNNKSRWIRMFPVTYAQVLNMTGISNVKTYYSAIEELESLGYITWFKAKNQFAPARFIIKELYDQDDSYIDDNEEAF